jgi:hypothetical protein
MDADKNQGRATFLTMVVIAVPIRHDIPNKAPRRNDNVDNNPGTNVPFVYIFFEVADITFERNAMSSVYLGYNDPRKDQR